MITGRKVTSVIRDDMDLKIAEPVELCHTGPDDMAPHITDAGEYRKHLQRISTVMNQHVQDRRHYDADGMCIKCPNCGSDGPFKDLTMDLIDVYNGSGPATEIQINCTHCNENVAYWAYGSYDPSYSWFHPEDSPK